MYDIQKLYNATVVNQNSIKYNCKTASNSIYRSIGSPRKMFMLKHAAAE